MDVSENNGTPKSSVLIGFFHYKPSILGYPYFWKQPDWFMKSSQHNWLIPYNPTNRGEMTIAHFMNLDFFQIEVHPLSSLRWRLLENPHGSDRKYIDSFMVNLPASHVSFAGGGGNFWKGFPNKMKHAWSKRHCLTRCMTVRFQFRISLLYIQLLGFVSDAWKKVNIYFPKCWFNGDLPWSKGKKPPTKSKSTDLFGQNLGHGSLKVKNL